MRTFKDRNNRDWSIEITVAAMKRVRDALKINLYDLVDESFAKLQRLPSDPMTLVDIVFVLCQPQAKAAGISDEQFGESLAAESLAAMADAFFEAFLDFFPDRRMAEILRKQVAKAKAVAEKVAAEMEKTVDALNVQSLVESLKKTSGGPPASSDSTPALSRSANSP